MGIRNMLALLGEMGLAGKVCEAYDVTTEDLEMLAVMEAEIRELQRKPGD